MIVIKLTGKMKFPTTKDWLQSKAGKTLKIKNKAIVASNKQSIFNGGSWGVTNAFLFLSVGDGTV